MSAVCKLFGHQLRRSQVWGTSGKHDGHGRWMILAVGCGRCGIKVPLYYYLADAAIAKATGSAA